MGFDVRAEHFIGFHPYRMFEPANADRMGYKRPYQPLPSAEVTNLSAAHTEAYNNWRTALLADSPDTTAYAKRMSEIYQMILGVI